MENGMKKHGVFLSLIGSALFLVSPLSWSVTGVVNFTGEIVNSTCTIDLGENREKTVVIGRYPSSAFPSAGSVSPATAFTLTLTGCEPGEYKLRFEGVATDSDPQLLKVEGGAEGVGVEILNASNEAVPINMNTDSEHLLLKVDDQGGAAIFNLKARYKSLAQTVTPGEANASANFTIEYK